MLLALRVAIRDGFTVTAAQTPSAELGTSSQGNLLRGLLGASDLTAEPLPCRGCQSNAFFLSSGQTEYCSS